MNRADETTGPFQSDEPRQRPPQDPHAPPQEEPKAFNVFGLRNDTPPVTPSSIGEQLDLAAEWWEHLACGFAKQRNSENPEAWEHYVLAAILFGREAGLLPENVDWSEAVGDNDESGNDDGGSGGDRHVPDGHTSMFDEG